MSKSEEEECAHKLKETGKRLMLSCIQVGSNLDLGHGVISEPIIGASHTIVTIDKAVRVGFQLGEDAAQALHRVFYPS
ncbi:carbohydrate esterase family 10 protein [Rhizoctonia solani]|uniref:Carbohydrate esterase family 10 protein n=1 Tax=Rhizoctonia solani TaxID=456999 RepID=A0A8H8NTX6_9AGAM|nr:carbohydrate esterase family 10 protein [Rhizoctonia solani]QRW18682.1 carbohydrate esterase family 10 protein [Rhizoctonia solani]